MVINLDHMNLNEFINLYSTNHKINTDVLDLFSAITLKDGTQILDKAARKELIGNGGVA